MADSNFGVGVGNDEAPEIDTVESLWTEKLESYFVYLMVEEISKGTMQVNTFAKAAWQSIAEILRKTTGKEYTYYQLKNKYHNLRTRWSDFSALLMEKEVQFDLVTGEVFATEDVWKRLYSKYRRAQSFRKKGLKDYDKLCIVFGDPQIQLPKSFRKKILRDEKLRVVLGDPGIQFYSKLKDEECKNKVFIDYTESEGDTPRVMRGQALDGVDALKASGKAIMKDRANKRVKLEKKMSFTPSLDSVADSGDGYGYQVGQVEDVVRCMESLNELEGIDGASYVKATRFIHDDSLWRKMFLCMPNERKKDWVLNI